MVEPGKRGVFGLAARQKGSEIVERGKLEVSRPGADAAAAVVLNEVDSPSIAVVVEVEQDAGHEDSIDRTACGMSFHSAAEVSLRLLFMRQATL
jgi:hypothetical protein